MKKIYIHFSIFILFIAIILAFSGCGRKNAPVVENNLTPALSSEEREKATSSSEVVETATSSEDVDTSDWKVYRNTEYGYSIKYPKDWTLRELVDSNTKTGASFLKNNDKIIIDMWKAGVKLSNESFEQYVYDLGYQVSEHPYDLMKGFKTVSGIKGYIINWNESMEDYGVGVDHDMAYFEAKKQGFYKDMETISVRYGTSPTEYSTKIFNSMIKTFDYID